MTMKSSALLAVLLTALAGCAGTPTKKVVNLTGTVTLNGKQLKSGVIKFVAPNGDVATTSILPDGKFIVTDVVPGVQKVGLVSEPQGSGGPEGQMPTKQVNVPSKFIDPEKSGVTVTAPPEGGEVVVEFK